VSGAHCQCYTLSERDVDKSRIFKLTLTASPATRGVGRSPTRLTTALARSLGGLSHRSICNSKPLLTSAAGFACRVVPVLQMTTARPPGKNGRPRRGPEEMYGRTDGRTDSLASERRRRLQKDVRDAARTIIMAELSRTRRRASCCEGGRSFD